MTYSDYITDALRMIGVLMANESATAEQGTQGLTALNDMMAEWAADAINVGYVPSETTTDDLNLHASVRSAVKANLAIRLSAFYPSAPVSQATIKQAQDGYASLSLQAAIEEAEPANMRNIPRGTRFYNIATDQTR